MKSNKGMRHGVDKSKLQDHYMAPLATRRVLMIELAVLPDAERTEGVSLPATNELDKLVCKLRRPTVTTWGKATRASNVDGLRTSAMESVRQ